MCLCVCVCVYVCLCVYVCVFVCVFVCVLVEFILSTYAQPTSNLIHSKQCNCIRTGLIDSQWCDWNFSLK